MAMPAPVPRPMFSPSPSVAEGHDASPPEEDHRQEAPEAERNKGGALRLEQDSHQHRSGEGAGAQPDVEHAALEDAFLGALPQPIQSFPVAPAHPESAHDAKRTA